MFDGHPWRGNAGAIEDRGWDPLNEIQEDTGLGGWPFTDPVQRSLIWGAAARLLRQLNEPALLSVGVEVHPNKSKDHIISVGSSGTLGLFVGLITSCRTKLTITKGKRWVPPKG